MDSDVRMAAKLVSLLDVFDGAGHRYTQEASYEFLMALGNGEAQQFENAITGYLTAITKMNNEANWIREEPKEKARELVNLVGRWLKASYTNRMGVSGAIRNLK